MGTHSLIIMQTNEKGKLIVYAVLYQQYDGYYKGKGSVGTQLFTFLRGMQVVNGIPLGVNTDKSANGAGDLFAQLVSHFKGRKVGGAYLVAPSDYQHEEYNYFVTVDEKEKTIKIRVAVASGFAIATGANLEISAAPERTAEEWLQVLGED